MKLWSREIKQLPLKSHIRNLGLRPRACLNSSVTDLIIVLYSGLDEWTAIYTTEKNMLRIQKRRADKRLGKMGLEPGKVSEREAV